MVIKHVHVAVPNEIVASAFWNQDHAGDATPEVHDNTKHTVNYLAPGDNVSELVNDAGYITSWGPEADPVYSAWIAGPPNVSEFTNDAGYIVAEADPVFTAWDKDHADLSNVLPDQHHARQHDVEAAADHTNINALRDSAFKYRLIGKYFTTMTISGVGTAVETEDTLKAFPFFVPVQMSFDRIGMITIGAFTNARVRLAIYADTGNVYPGALVVDSGDIACGAPSGLHEAAINATLTPGLYWLVSNWDLNGDIAGNVTLTSSAASMVVGIDPLGKYTTNATSYAYYSLAQAYGAMPSPFTGGATEAAGRGILTMVRRSA